MSAECANPLYLQWIKEWLDLAKERNTKAATTYKRAYTSLKACPLVLTHPSEVTMLGGWGDTLCKRLTERLKEHCTENGIPMPKRPHRSRKRQSLPEPEEEAAPVKKPRKTKPYVPTFESGPYALILALSTLAENSTAGLTKAQTIAEAQPHCEVSFTAPSDTTKFYTAWNSMKTLIEKDLVYERGRPQRKYALTEEGWVVAKRIKKAAGAGAGDKVADKPAEQARPAVSEGFVTLGDDSGDDHIPTRRTTHKAPVAMEANNQTTNGFHSNGQRLGGNPSDKFGVLEAAKVRINRHSNTDTVEFLNLLSSSPLRSTAPTRNTSLPRPEDTDYFKETHPPNTTTSLPNASKATTITTTTTTTTTTADFPSFEPIRLNPGTFTIELILDNREIRARTDRDYIQDELVKKGVNPIIRSLELGDALWVAKCTDPAMLSRYGEEGDEIVLDWIAERKRLDDLVGSIKDGRFHEQKFRLRKSGIKNVIYIIEEISLSHETATKYHEAIDSAIASMQVVNGYFVKRTQKLDETIRYLARMTAMLKSLYESQPLHLIPTPTLQTPTSHLPLLTHLRTTPPHNERTYHLTYPTFSSLASKSESLTLRDVFLKMLMCTRGVTGDKAVGIQKVWGTPRAFVEGFEGVGGEKEKREMVSARLGQVVGRGKVGRALSGKIAEVWGEGGAEGTGTGTGTGTGGAGEAAGAATAGGTGGWEL